MTEVATHRLDVPGAVICYDVRPGREPGGTPLFLVGSPMGASGFASLAAHFGDRTVVTYDPRGVERSAKADPDSQSTPEQHADDLASIVAALALGPVDMFASSGGAVNALALLATHPETLRKLVAHEPPLGVVLPDSEAALATCRSVAATYQSSGWGAGMAHFMAVVGHTGPFSADYPEEPGPDPTQFGMPSHDDGSRNDPLLGQNIITCTHFVPDFGALEGVESRLLVAAGIESRSEMAHRAAVALAERLGKEVVLFPSHHGGFLGGEHGYAGEPEAFATRLREVLAD